MPAAYPVPTQMVQQLWDRFVLWVMRTYPMRDVPLNIRPGMVFATAIWIILLGVLGMAPLPTIPINDKALHFFGLGFATFLLYFVLEVPDGPGRRIWYFHRAPLVFTLVTAFFFGGIVSEFVQGMLPWKSFQLGDIAANLLGSTVFLYLAHLADKRHQRRLELSSLYQPLSEHSSSTYRDAQGRSHAFQREPGHQPPRLDDASAPAPGQGATVGPGTVYGRRERGNSEVWESDSDLDRSSQDTARGHGTTPAGTQLFALGDDDEEDGRTSVNRLV
ncbi:hypothetical protein IAU60_005522 [Kwoniella sp. DSM 27419]